MDLFRRFVRQFKNGDYRLEITDIKEKRSDQQNRYYWGVYLPLIAEDSGHTTEELHAYFRGKYSSVLKKVFGQNTRVGKSTTKMTKSEFSEYIMNIESETGVVAPDTTEYLGYSYRK